jgi:hypothetical protein
MTKQSRSTESRTFADQTIGLGATKPVPESSEAKAVALAEVTLDDLGGRSDALGG